ncbi:hypothetical protein AVEN_22976-1 [Araneus ventricosus]|uniref:Uncharacterized protein n=1 Tax=Araneus ventricosus TaxID=182803 RepID=A0A4Y1ZQ51_ARAVE|nr:hypothetical protein AVEN_189699-1 [Araneus ventricosus]GBL61613.1 hypothetical protein AVEN_22976-1 [Araneus ventricosus]
MNQDSVLSIGNASGLVLEALFSIITLNKQGRRLDLLPKSRTRVGATPREGQLVVPLHVTSPLTGQEMESIHLICFCVVPLTKFHSQLECNGNWRNSVPGIPKPATTRHRLLHLSLWIYSR